MKFYNFLQEFPEYKTSLGLPFDYEIDPKEIKFAREKYEQYLDYVSTSDPTADEQTVKTLRDFYATLNDEFIIRMFTINFFNLSYTEENETIDHIFGIFMRMRQKYGYVTFFQGALAYPETYIAKEIDFIKDGERMSELIPHRISKLDAFPKDVDTDVVLLGYMNLNALHCTIFIGKEQVEEELIQLIGNAMLDEWKKYFMFMKNKKKNMFDM